MHQIRQLFSGPDTIYLRVPSSLTESSGSYYFLQKDVNRSKQNILILSVIA